MKVLITGGSHTVALNQGLKRLAESGRIPQAINFLIRPLGGGLSVAGEFFSIRQDHVEITNEKFRRKFRRIPPKGESYDVIVLSTALYSRPVWNKADWAIYGIPGLSKDRLLASDSMLRRAILDDNKHLIFFLQHLRSCGIQVCTVEAPRPFRHNIEVDRAGVDLVRKIDHFYRSSTLEILARKSIPAVLVPTFALDKDGFMLEKYRHKNPKDKTHGNVDFGELMVLEILDYLQDLREPGTDCSTSS